MFIGALFIIKTGSEEWNFTTNKKKWFKKLGPSMKWNAMQPLQRMK